MKNSNRKNGKNKSKKEEEKAFLQRFLETQ